MAKIEPIVIDILFENGGVILEDFFVQKLSEEIDDLEKEKIEKGIEKLVKKNKIYRLEDKYISLTDFGDLQEDKIDELLKKIVHPKFLFKNPKFTNPNGKEEEFCDNMIFFDGNLIIIQSKTKNYTTLENFERFQTKCIDNSIKQLDSSIRVSKNEIIEKKFKNELGEEIELNNTNIKKIIGLNICYFHQDKDYFISKGWKNKLKHLDDIPNILTYQELKKIINLNDTLPDFLEYLDKRRVLVQKEIPLLSEYQILSYFFYTNHTMLLEGMSKTDWTDSSLIILDEGFEEELERGELKNKLDKREEDNKKSYFIDNIINKIIKNVQNEQDIFFIELLRLNRFNRRLISNRMLPIYNDFITKKQDFRAPFIRLNENLGILFIFSKKSDNFYENEQILKVHSLIMKNRHKLQKIIGISENHYKDGTVNHSFCILEGDIKLDESDLPKEFFDNLNDKSKMEKLDTIYEFN